MQATNVNSGFQDILLREINKNMICQNKNEYACKIALPPNGKNKCN
jgi:hypothetical protein